MLENPIVSIIIPVYNAERYLKECLDSVMNQTLVNIEILCVNDSSTDNSLDIINSYVNMDSRFHCISYEVNKTASQARKDAVARSRGKYIMFMDADDVLEYNACQVLADKMNCLNVDILQFGTFIDAESGINSPKIDMMARFTEPYCDYLFGKEVFLYCFRDKKYRFNLWNKIYKSDLCKKAFEYVKDGAYPKAQDLYAFFMISYFANSYYGVHEKFYHYKYGRGLHGFTSGMTKKTFSRYCSQYRVAEECCEFLLLEKVWDDYCDVWRIVYKDLASECIGHWLNSVVDSDRKECLDLLLKSWGNKCVIDRIENGFKLKWSEITKDYPTCNNNENIDVLVEDKQLKNDAIIPRGYEKVIPIVFATNDKYAPCTGIAIYSLLKNTKDNVFYRIYVLHTGISSFHKDKLQALENEYSTIRCINVEERIDNYTTTLHIRAHFSKEMYYRFLIPEIFHFYKEVVYLDCDILVFSCISEMIPKCMNDYCLAAVKNYCIRSNVVRLARDFNLDSEKYFNSGVLVFNIKQWKKEKLVEKCFDLLKNTPKELLLNPDQDILNVACKDSVLYLDESWNYYWHMNYGIPEMVNRCQEVRRRISGNYNILHFASNKKPWNMPNLPESSLFWKYARETEFYEELLLMGMENFVNVQNNVNEKFEQNNRKIQKLQDELDLAKKKLANIKHANESMKNSLSFRIGRAITFIPRKVRDLFK